MYVEYDFYTNTYGGKVSSVDFPRLEIQASTLIDYYTFNRVKEVNDKIKYAVCELVDYLKELDRNGGKEISQESIGSQSVSYVTGENQLTAEQKKFNIVKKHLAHSGLLYRGVK